MSDHSNIWTSLIAPLFGLIICEFMWASPLPVILKARASRDLGPINPYPFLATIANCIGWTMYGIMNKDFFLVIANITGMVLGLFYTVTCMTILAKKSSSDTFTDCFLILEGSLCFICFFWAAIGMVGATAFTSFPDPQQEATKMVGTIGMTCSIAYYAAPCATMLQVVRTRDGSSIYLPMILVNLMNAFLWFVYGAFGVQDINISLPNGIGIVLAVVQISLALVFRRRSLWQTVLGSTDPSPSTPSSMAESLDSNRSTSALKLPPMHAEVLYDENEMDEEMLANLQGSQGNRLTLELNPMLKAVGGQRSGMRLG